MNDILNELINQLDYLILNNNSGIVDFFSYPRVEVGDDGPRHISV